MGLRRNWSDPRMEFTECHHIIVPVGDKDLGTSDLHRYWYSAHSWELHRKANKLAYRLVCEVVFRTISMPSRGWTTNVVIILCSEYNQEWVYDNSSISERLTQPTWSECCQNKCKGGVTENVRQNQERDQPTLRLEKEYQRWENARLSVEIPKWGKVPEMGAWHVISPTEHRDLGESKS